MKRATRQARNRDMQLAFREPVLQRANYRCAICGEPATVADHYARTRRKLVAAGLDPNAPQYGRALCKRCHDRHTGRWQRSVTW